jgi:hypothetical protein
MTACAQCSRELQPEWKFCIYCGAWTGVPITEAIAIIRGEAPGATTPAPAEDLVETDDELDELDEPDDDGWDDGWDDEPADRTASEVETAPGSDRTASEFETAPGDTAEVLRAEDIPDDEAAIPADVAPVAPPRVNILAVLALILGCLVSPLAALFGHLALAQISRTGERGTAIAWVAIVLGYLSLAALLVLGISYLVLNA